MKPSEGRYRLMTITYLFNMSLTFFWYESWWAQEDFQHVNECQVLNIQLIWENALKSFKNSYRFKRDGIPTPWLFSNSKGNDKLSRLVSMDYNSKDLRVNPSQVWKHDMHWDPLDLASWFEEGLIHIKVTSHQVPAHRPNLWWYLTYQLC